MKFIDRQDEIGRLDSLMGKEDGALGVVWGRRRIGKTRLLLEWCRKRDGLYTVADQSSAPVQRQYMAEAVSVRFPGFAAVKYPDWKSLFDRLAQASSSSAWHGPVVIDELPYMVVTSPELPSVLQRWIDHDARQCGLVMVVAGSSQRMMQGLVLDSTAPLYGRAAECFGLLPLRAGYIAEGLELKNSRDAVEAYTLWGGVPKYWELARSFGNDLDSAVGKIVMDPQGPLHAEPDRLLLEELPPAVALRPLLDVIGAGANRLTEIAGRIGSPVTSLARPMGRLVGLGLVERIVPFGEPEKSSKRCLYRISDPFFRFWFRVVAPNRALLAGASSRTSRSLWRGMKDHLTGETWEDLCRLSLAGMNDKDMPLAKYGPWQAARSFWHGNGPQWDVVSLSLDGRHILLGEAKWLSGTAEVRDLKKIAHDLTAKGVPPSIDVAEDRIHRVVFVPEASSSIKEIDGTSVITADTVLACLR